MASRKLPRSPLLPTLNLEDLASVIDGELGELSQEASSALTEFVRVLYSDDPAHSEKLAELQQMTRDAGCEFLGDGLFAHECLEKLLAADTWDHPVDVLGGEREDVIYSRIIGIAAARAERADDPEAILDVKRRVEGAYAEHLTGQELVESVVERLLQLDSETAERTLERLTDHHRFRRRRASAT
jgi:hypothetical protein